MFFSLINAARLYGNKSRNALERTNLKFIKRFNYLEEKTNTTRQKPERYDIS
jgi:XTP/dITP diphosphohydrolase